MKKILSLVYVTLMILATSLCLTACGGSRSSSDGGPLMYILAFALIIGGIVALFVDGKKHGIIYVIGEIVMVILLITFG